LWQFHFLPWHSPSLIKKGFGIPTSPYQASDFALRATTGQVAGQAGFSPTTDRITPSLIKKERFKIGLLIFMQIIQIRHAGLDPASRIKLISGFRLSPE
jgi:hypothetical protein